MTENDPIEQDFAPEPGRAAAFSSSDIFPKLFEEGMALVEETARYLDNEGRADAKQLDRGPALAYATVSMRLTTKLMQIASWLLVLRSLREGRMSEADAAAPKHRLRPARLDIVQSAHLPPRLADLNEAANAVYERVQRLDASLFATRDERETTEAGDGDAAARLDALKRAFGA